MKKRDKGERRKEDKKVKMKRIKAEVSEGLKKKRKEQDQKIKGERRKKGDGKED